MFDTPPIALDPLFAHEPLLRGVTAVAEPFAGEGNLGDGDARARDRRARVRHFRAGAPILKDPRLFRHDRGACPVLISNPPYSQATALLEHAFAIGFRSFIFLLTTNYLHTGDRYERVHKRGHLARVYPLAERSKACTTGPPHTGPKASQPQVHSWFVFDRDHFGPATINPVSLHRPNERMPWLEAPDRRMGAVSVSQFGLTASPLGGDLHAHAVLGGLEPARSSRNERRDTSMNRENLSRCTPP